MRDWDKSEARLVEFFDEWQIPRELLSALEPLRTEDLDRLRLDMFYPGEAVPFAGKWQAWSTLLRYKLLPIGNCPNTDFIAVDWAIAPGAVFFVSVDEFDTTGTTTHDMKEISICVAPSVSVFLEGLRNNMVPMDYQEATERNSNNRNDGIGE